MLKILHISPEHYTGTLMTFVRTHRAFGNVSRLITMYPNWCGYEEDINLNLPLVGNKWYLRELKKLLSRENPMPSTVLREWNPKGLERLFFRIRDALWRHKIEKSIADYNLFDFDIYHFHAGVDLFRDARFAIKLKTLGKKIVCHYHGTDLRNRGVIRAMDELSDLNLTCEFDHLSLHPNIRYLFLPFDVFQYSERERENDMLRICHAPTSRFFKGSDVIIDICNELEHEGRIEFVLIEGRSHDEAIRLKRTCDIAIDQIANLGGLGYGVNSLETLAMGIPTCTNLTTEYETFLSDHPFINVDATNLKEKLEYLIKHEEFRRRKGHEGRVWVERVHAAKSVVQKLYEIYQELGWMTRNA
ncbi:MAG: glycosyltransferase [Gemmatimonadota bacterium]|nr:MAG: glycosyltransferase [Gemmatimonadota bacterium]